VPAGLDARWQRAEQQVPGWVAISLRIPPRPDGPLTFVIQEPVGWHPAPRSQLVLSASTGEVVKWEPFAGQNRLRAWVRPLHTGEAGGIAGQAVAAVTSAGTTVLVWTALAGLAAAPQRAAAHHLQKPRARGPDQPRSVSGLT
jgi:uncharacterized iron-regulated membrane protein